MQTLASIQPRTRPLKFAASSDASPAKNPRSKELIAHLVFDGDPGLDDGDVLVLGETIVPTTETSAALESRRTSKLFAANMYFSVQN